MQLTINHYVQYQFLSRKTNQCKTNQATDIQLSSEISFEIFGEPESDKKRQKPTEKLTNAPATNIITGNMAHPNYESHQNEKYYITRFEEGLSSDNCLAVYIPENRPNETHSSCNRPCNLILYELDPPFISGLILFFQYVTGLGRSYFNFFSASPV